MGRVSLSHPTLVIFTALRLVIDFLSVRLQQTLVGFSSDNSSLLKMTYHSIISSRKEVMVFKMDLAIANVVSVAKLNAHMLSLSGNFWGWGGDGLIVSVFVLF